MEVQIPRVRFQPQLQQVDEVPMNIPRANIPRVEEPPRMRIRDRIRDPSSFRLCDDKECVDVHISPLRVIQENYTPSSSSTSIIVWIAVAILFLVIVYMAFNNIYPFRFFENLMF
jgi:hypothetical protein